MTIRSYRFFGPDQGWIKCFSRVLPICLSAFLDDLQQSVHHGCMLLNVSIHRGDFPFDRWFALCRCVHDAPIWHTAFRHNYGTQYQFSWFSRDGRTLGTIGDPGLLSVPRISPDQKAIAFQRTSDQNPDVWTFDLMRNTSARFTFEPGADSFPVWSPDGKSIVYESTRGGGWLVVERPASGVGKEMIIAGPAGNVLAPTAVSHDDRWLVLTEASALHSIITIRSREDSSKVVRVQDRQTERDGSISPDGRWLLYSSIPATRREVLV